MSGCCARLTSIHLISERADLLGGTSAVCLSAVDETMVCVWLLEPGPKPKRNKSKKTRPAVWESDIGKLRGTGRMMMVHCDGGCEMVKSYRSFAIRRVV